MFRETRWGGNGIIGDSIIATMDTYDQRVYAIGKGPTETTISASVSLNNDISVSGYVMDISPGTKQDDLMMRFPHGVPAVSDESQSDWMLYVWKQFQRPANATGVTVSLDVIDSNENFRNIGTTTTDSSGFFNFVWTPDISGAYTIIATFPGTNAYYASYSEAGVAVGGAIGGGGSPTPTPSGGTGTTVDMYFIPSVIAIIIVIIIVGAVLALLIRRR